MLTRDRICRIVLWDAKGRPTQSFCAGDRLAVECEIDVRGMDGVPVIALSVLSDAGLLIHRCESFLDTVYLNAVVRWRRSIELRLPPGAYRLAIGLGAVDPGARVAWENGNLSRHHLEKHVAWLAVIDEAGQIEVVPPDAEVSAHIGLMDLPGDTHIEVLETCQPASVDRSRDNRAVNSSTTVFHVTHWKAGSQWIHKILRELFPAGDLVSPQPGMEQFLELPIRKGKIYPTVYLSSRDFYSVDLPDNARKFVVIRDLRDTLVSWYFSLRHSHPTLNTLMGRMQARLAGLNVEDGLLLMMDKWLSTCAWIQHSWLETGEELIRYEDLLEDDIGILERVLIGQCGLPVSHERLREVVESTRFERVTGGRRRGEEDVTQHMRKGVAGDWRNHFTDRTKDVFKLRCGRLLVALGYESDDNW